MSKSKQVNKRSVTEQDAIIGDRIRVFRTKAQMSQAVLGSLLVPPVSFQQVQKYEKGVNRVTFPRLQQICAALEVTIGDFSETAATSKDAKTLNHFMDLLNDRLAFRMVTAFAKLDIPVQRSLVALAESQVGAR